MSYTILMQFGHSTDYWERGRLARTVKQGLVLIAGETPALLVPPHSPPDSSFTFSIDMFTAEGSTRWEATGGKREAGKRRSGEGRREARKEGKEEGEMGRRKDRKPSRFGPSPLWSVPF